MRVLTNVAAWLTAVAASGALLAGQGKIIQRVLVKVNGEIFTQTDFEQRQLGELRDQKKQIDKREDLQNDPTLIAAIKELTPDLLVDVVDELLLVQHGREAGYRLTDEMFKTNVDELKKKYKLDDEGFKKALADELLTMDSYRQQMEQTYIIRQVQQEEIMQRAALTDEEKHQYYKDHPNEFLTPATITLREIFIAVVAQMQNGKAVINVGADDDAKSKILAARERAVKGEDFARIVGDVSESASKASGGLVEPIDITQIDPALRVLIDKIKPGEVSEPFRTARGYQIFKLEARSESTPEPFDKVRDAITQKVYEARLEIEKQKFLKKIRVQALIEWKDDSLKQIYEKRLAERLAGK
jgi:parvulin-like peptidyl-prolyl isomerase